jgi:predicted RNA-binding Zn-ribbon protein involved in translation (DUF1610 family)
MRNKPKKGGKFCPVCGSDNIHLWMGAELGIRYRCVKCGYIGPIVLEPDTKKRKGI